MVKVKMIWNKVDMINSKSKTKINWFSVVIAGMILLVILIALGYPFTNSPSWLGIAEYSTTPKSVTTSSSGTNVEVYPAKTLWDFLELVIVPLSIAITVYWLNKSDQEATSHREIDAQRDTALREYLKEMSNHILELGSSTQTERILYLARLQTLQVLLVLDGTRKSLVLRFLYEANLIDKDNPMIELSGADFRFTNMGGVNLLRCNLVGADFRNSYLFSCLMYDCDLRGCDFRKSDLTFIKLNWSNLGGAVLDEADLSHSELVRTDLRYARFYGANLTGASLYEAIFDGHKLSEKILTYQNTRTYWRNDLDLLDEAYDNMTRIGFEKAKVKGLRLTSGVVLPGYTGEEMNKRKEIERCDPIQIDINLVDEFTLRYIAINLRIFDLDRNIATNIIKRRDEIGAYKTVDDFKSLNKEYGDVISKLAQFVVININQYNKVRAG